MNNLPPGVTNRMIEEQACGDGTCAVCRKEVDECICVECPKCHTHGDPNCYVDLFVRCVSRRTSHGLELTRAQKISRAEADILDAEDRLAEAHMHLEQLQGETGE